jgi:hypothetical protein
MRTAAILVSRLIFTFVFGMAAAFKFADVGATAAYIGGAGFPVPLLLAWLAAFFEVVLVIAFLSGLDLREAVLTGAQYVLFLVRLPRSFALGKEPGRVRLFHRPLQVHRRTSVGRRYRAGPSASRADSGNPSGSMRWQTR